jgi:ferredoxin
MAELWTLEDLKGWSRTLLARHRVVAPVEGPGGTGWAEVAEPEAIAWGYTQTAVSPREWLVPRTECLFRYDLMENPPKLEEPPLEARPTVLLLVRPCDVAGLRALDAVMRWDYTEEGYEARRAATLLVSLGCNRPASPETCFCESIGLDARIAREADVAIEEVMEGQAEAKDAPSKGAGPMRADASNSAAEGGRNPETRRFRVMALTEAGRAVLEGAPAPISPAPAPSAPGPSASGRIGTQLVDLESATGWMRAHFDDPLWEELSEACLGCGACAYVCPSCHCFDVVDEGDWRRGSRVRNWDSCAFGHFTAHASGHNPRPRQWNRYRQRLFHKFVYYPDKFGRMLCTGCGRCVQHCPGGMDLIEILTRLSAVEAKQS